jgi:pantetheine-phosphate adenylyltransferase
MSTTTTRTWNGSEPAWNESIESPGDPVFRFRLSSHAEGGTMAIPKTSPYRTAVFTGTFDPITLGHLDVIRRGRLLFERVIVGIGVNPNKMSLFNVQERVEMARLVVRDYPNVSVDSFEGLTVQYVRRIGAQVILRGLRTLSDMEYEFGMTLTNHRLDPSIETVFLMADGEYSHVSSSLIKQVASYGGTEALKRFVPEELIALIQSKLQTVGPRGTD